LKLSPAFDLCLKSVLRVFFEILFGVLPGERLFFGELLSDARISGEGGHAAMKAPTERVSKSSYSLGLKQGGLEGERQQQEYPNQDNRCYDNDSKEKSGHSRPTPERLICSIRPT
jgi:hypothetical protein